MSTIAGVLRFDGAPCAALNAASVSRRMTAAAPDGPSAWDGEAIAFACGLLRNREETERRAEACASGRALAIAWDGRLDNRPELKSLLGGRFVTNESDARLVLAAYAKWGARAPSRLAGDFAFAVWDSANRILFCARDPAGARPLFFARTRQFFAFASQDDALAALEGVSTGVNEERIANHLLPAYTGFDTTRSWLRDVEAVGAGETLVIDPGGRLQRDVYWRPQVMAQAVFRSESEAVEEFRSVFSEAVRARLPGGDGAALMLSGGLDSSAILATADALNADVATYSVVTERPVTCLESECIEDLTRGRSRAQLLRMPSFTGFAAPPELADLAWSRPHPIDHSLFLPAMICKAASRDGHRVVLTGVCGDLTLHASHAYVGSLLAEGHFRQAWRESVAASRNHTRWREIAPSRIIAGELARRIAPAPLRSLARRWRGARKSYLRGSLIHPEFAQRVGALAWLAARRGEAPLSHQDSHVAGLLPPYGIASSLGAYNRVAARWGVEIADPWADRRVVEFCLRLPLEWKFRGGWTKFIVRRAFEGELPASVTRRIGKQHVGWQLVKRLMCDSRDRAESALEGELACVDNFVEPGAARRLIRRYLSGGDYVDCANSLEVLTLIAWVKACANNRPE